MPSLAVALLALLLGSAAVAATAWAGDNDIPADAQPRAYGAGWECKRGFERKGEKCREIELPQNAVLSPGVPNGWQCKR